MVRKIAINILIYHHTITTYVVYNFIIYLFHKLKYYIIESEKVVCPFFSMTNIEFSISDAKKPEEGPDVEKKAEEVKTEEAPKKNFLDMSLDEISKQNREEKIKKNQEKREQLRKEGKLPRDRPRRDHRDEKPIYTTLNLSDKEARLFAQSSGIDTDGYNVQLRLVRIKKHGRY